MTMLLVKLELKEGLPVSLGSLGPTFRSGVLGAFTAAYTFLECPFTILA